MSEYSRDDRLNSQNDQNVKYEAPKKPKKKRKLFKKIFVLLIIAVILFIGFMIFKLFSLSNDINQPLDREYSEYRDNKVSYLKGEPFSVAIFGVDSDSERGLSGGERSDAIMLLSINPKEKKTMLVSIPRDTRTEIVGYDTFEKINHAYAYGGPEMAVNTVENFMGAPVDHYVAMNMDSVKHLIDSVGGVKVKSNGTFTVKGIDFVEGETYKMDGDTALKFIRSRYEEGSGGDNGRQERQQLVLESLATKMLSPKGLLHINSVFDTLGDNVKTDLSSREISLMALRYYGAKKNVERVQLEGEDAVLNDGLWYFIPYDESINEISNAYRQNLGLE
ncbi:LCP family protein [Nosocomiicoccus massiliensis]|uniref:LCP family protein n=1 Tax=Nosocomiicoccus massiliensis TaxID=1232430 RepID=A0AAF0YHH9_9STAP|nr:LCP family protein [Nosocomiicoccus massiliensis]WOS95998.1 LCP family protein [Nosocomiicoccus massiliensis]